jgi:voltage-gated potassium channel
MTKQKLYQIIFETDTRAGRLFDEILLVLIFVSVVIVMLRSVGHLNNQYGQILFLTQTTITLLFTIEYALRIRVSPNKKKYMFSFFGIIDLLSILPSYIGVFIHGHSLIMLRSLRLLRLFRILKLGKYTSASTLLWNSLKASAAKITVFLMTVLIIVLIAGTLMYLVEGPEAGFVDIPTAVYRAIVTITTVGYGDITPLTPFGQMLSAMLMIL